MMKKFLLAILAVLVVITFANESFADAKNISLLENPDVSIKEIEMIDNIINTIITSGDLYLIISNDNESLKIFIVKSKLIKNKFNEKETWLSTSAYSVSREFGKYSIIIEDNLIKKLNKEQISAVLAHEIGHIILVHCDRRYNDFLEYQLYYNKRNIISVLIANIKMIFKAFFKYQKDETHADKFAVRILEKLDIDPNNLITALLRLDIPEWLDKLDIMHPRMHLRINSIISFIN